MILKQHWAKVNSIYQLNDILSNGWTVVKWKKGATPFEMQMLISPPKIALNSAERALGKIESFVQEVRLAAPKDAVRGQMCEYIQDCIEAEYPSQYSEERKVHWQIFRGTTTIGGGDTRWQAFENAEFNGGFRNRSGEGLTHFMVSEWMNNPLLWRVKQFSVVRTYIKTGAQNGTVCRNR